MENLTELKIARKACRHCAYTKHHLGTKEELTEVFACIARSGKPLLCHEYTEKTICASHAIKKKIKGKKQISRGDLKQKYAHITKARKNTCGLNGIKITTDN